ncbi:hypothetical protein BVL54_20100 [Bacillus paralicheniformis]|nr:hypothetical protein BVL54_20100 [Bacillus paralicheniformis]
MSVAQRLYEDIRKNGKPHEKEVLNLIVEYISDNPHENLDFVYELMKNIALLTSEEDLQRDIEAGKRTIYDYIVFMDNLYAMFKIEAPHKRRQREQEEEERKEKYPPLKLVR